MGNVIERGEIERDVVTSRSWGAEKFSASSDGNYRELFLGGEADDFRGLLGGCGLGECGRRDAIDCVKFAVRGFSNENGVRAEDGLQTSDGAVGDGTHVAETGAGDGAAGAASAFGVWT